MKAKRLFSLLAAGILCFTALAGCSKDTASSGSEPVSSTTEDKGDDSKEAEDSKETEESDESGESSIGGEEPVDLGDTPSWRADTSPMTIEWFAAFDWYAKSFDPVNNMADKALLEETGITINYTTGDLDKLNALIISGSMPEVMTFEAVAPQRLQLENGGLVENLDELTADFAPDLNVPQSQKDWYRNEDGNWYSIISYYYGPERTSEEYGGFLVTHNSNFVRTDILEQIGMTMDDLHTKEGFYDALKAVKDQNIQYDGLEVIPLTGVYASHMAEQFGAQREDEEGNLLDIKMQPEYLEALKYYNKMYNDGLIREDEFTNETPQRDQLVASGQVFMSQGWMTVKQPRGALYASDQNAKIMYAGTIDKGDNGRDHYLTSVNSGGWTSTVITKNAENPGRIMTLFSYLSQDGVTLDEEYGHGCYDIVDGLVVRKPEAEKEYEEDYNAAYNKYNMNNGYIVDYTINQKYENPVVDNVLEQDRINMERDKDQRIFDDKCFTDVQPLAGTDLAAVKVQLDDYWETMEPQMIMAATEEECEKLYNEAIEQWKLMGYDALYESQNERFKENKAKLDLEFAWPSLQK